MAIEFSERSPGAERSECLNMGKIRAEFQLTTETLRRCRRSLSSSIRLRPSLHREHLTGILWRQAYSVPSLAHFTNVPVRKEKI